MLYVAIPQAFFRNSFGLSVVWEHGVANEVPTWIVTAVEVVVPNDCSNPAILQKEGIHEQANQSRVGTGRAISCAASSTEPKQTSQSGCDHSILNSISYRAAMR